MTPQNPLKPVRGMAPFEKRLKGARQMIRNRRIKVSAIEARFGTRYTADTLRALQRRFPKVRFVWLMGADNLAQIRHWQRWQEIFRRVPIAVFARPDYCLRGLAELAAKRFGRWRRKPAKGALLAESPPPAWVFLPIRLDANSATKIRAHRGRG